MPHNTQIPNCEWPWWNPYVALPLYSSALAGSHRTEAGVALFLSLSHWSRHAGASSHGNSILSKLKDVYVHTHTHTHAMFLINTSWMGAGDGALRRCSQLVLWVCFASKMSDCMIYCWNVCVSSSDFLDVCLRVCLFLRACAGIHWCLSVAMKPTDVRNINYYNYSNSFIHFHLRKWAN